MKDSRSEIYAEMSDRLVKIFKEGEQSINVLAKLPQKVNSNDHFRTIKTSAGLNQNCVITSIKRPG